MSQILEVSPANNGFTGKWLAQVPVFSEWFFLQGLHHSLACECCCWAAGAAPLKAFSVNGAEIPVQGSPAGSKCHWILAASPVGHLGFTGSPFTGQKHKASPHHELLGVVASAVNPWERIGLNTAFKINVKFKDLNICFMYHLISLCTCLTYKRLWKFSG